MNTTPQWKYLVRKPMSLYKQLFIKDRWGAARTLYGQYVGEGARTAEELAEDFNVPLEAVREAIAYCESNPPEIREDWEREEALMEATGMNDPNYKYNAKPKLLSPEERDRLNRQNEVVSPTPPYKYLARKPRSLYRQLFIKDRWVAARTIYGQYVGEGARTAEQLAEDFNVPLEAVREAIAYCESNPPEIAQDWAAEEALLEADGMKDPNSRYHARTRLLSPQEMARLNRL
jgi:uncharacterized protein (DUF433 family)